MRDLWKARNINEELKEVSEQRLADQIRQIKIKKWLENVEQDEIAMRVRNEHQQTDHNAVDTPNSEVTADTQEEHRDQDDIPAEDDRIVSTELESLGEISPEVIALRDRILEVMLLEEKAGLPSLKSCDRGKLRVEVGNGNEAAKRIETHNIAELNSFNVCSSICHHRKNGNVEEKERKNRRTILEEED